MGRPNKYGSLYDPANKLRSPKAQKQAEQESCDKLGPGCGNPACGICYPNGSSRSRRGNVEVRFGGWPEEGRPSWFSNAIQAEMSRLITSSFQGGSVGFDAGSPARKTPPASYTTARKAVAAWLVAAPEQAFDDIVGNEQALATLRDAIEAPVRHAELYAGYGMAMPKGALLHGPPGCGKTMFARAAASEMRRLYGGDEGTEFICLSGAELQSMYVGETEGYIKAIFTFAREYKVWRGHPLLVFIDEAEVLLPDRTGRTRWVAPWEESQVATFLAEMDGVQATGAFVLLATNRPEAIDSALLRDGRCDFKIRLARPTPEAAQTILERGFAGVRAGGDGAAALVTAAAESFYDPMKVISEAHVIIADLEKLELRDGAIRHFCLEHIVSGAMLAGVPARATRIAFARDRQAGAAEPSGVGVADVIAAVNQVFEENRRLEHPFAAAEFREAYEAEMQAEARAKLTPKGEASNGLH